MKLDEEAFGFASGATFGILWIVCSIVVWSLPTQMMRVSGHMMHGDFGMMSWSLSLFGFFIGLVAWIFIAALTGWLVAVLYNRISRSRRRD